MSTQKHGINVQYLYDSDKWVIIIQSFGHFQSTGSAKYFWSFGFYSFGHPVRAGPERLN